MKRKYILPMFLLVWGGLLAVTYAGEPNTETEKMAPQAPSPAPEVIDVLDKMDAVGKDVRTVRARFNYELNQTLYEDVQKRRGNLSYQTPNLLRFEFTDPPRETFIFDGRVLYHKKEATKQLILWELRGPQDPPVESFELGQTPFPLPFGQRKESVLKSFAVSRDAEAETADKEKRSVLVLVPKPDTNLARDYTRILLWVDAASWLPTRARLFDTSENITTVDFHPIEITLEARANRLGLLLQDFRVGRLRRPAESQAVSRPPRNQMNVQMRNHLPGAPAVVLENVHAIRREGRLDSRRQRRQLPAQVRRLLRRHLHDRTVMLLGNQKRMARRDGLDVHEHQAHLILINPGAGDLAGGNLAENAIGHAYSLHHTLRIKKLARTVEVGRARLLLLFALLLRLFLLSLFHKFKAAKRRRVAEATCSQFNQSRIASRPFGKPRRHVFKQFLGRRLVPQPRSHPPSGIQRSMLRRRNQPFRKPASLLGLGNRRGNGFMLYDRRCQLPERRRPMALCTPQFPSLL